MKTSDQTTSRSIQDLTGLWQVCWRLW